MRVRVRVWATIPIGLYINENMHTHPSNSFQRQTMFVIFQVPFVARCSWYMERKLISLRTCFKRIKLCMGCMSFDTMRNRISHCFSYVIDHKLWISHFKYVFTCISGLPYDTQLPYDNVDAILDRHICDGQLNSLTEIESHHMVHATLAKGSITSWILNSK